MALSIADYIIEALLAVDSLNSVKIFIRGVIPPALLSQDLYPYSEVFVSREAENSNLPRLTGNIHNRVYNGLITFSSLSTEISGGDWTDKTDARLIRVASYEEVSDLTAIALAELSRCEHSALADLQVTVEGAVESVTLFTPDSAVIYGIDRGARANNWENFASFEFQVLTQRQVTG